MNEEESTNNEYVIQNQLYVDWTHNRYWSEINASNHGDNTQKVSKAYIKGAHNDSSKIVTHESE